MIRQLRGIGLFFKRIFSSNQKYHHQSIVRNKQKETGFVLFSKPLYKPGDTVKLKAWITDRKENPITAQQSLWISYPANGWFSLNPAKVELMYFPMFFGREGIKEVGD